mmetsp:Transcript_4087/g.6603  ORF Transcript_4087/g.6603 Transcript_4087/m.6603 type:complete len:175 (+) Transcript_4087:126-650(+)
MWAWSADNEWGNDWRAWKGWTWWTPEYHSVQNAAEDNAREDDARLDEFPHTLRDQECVRGNQAATRRHDTADHCQRTLTANRPGLRLRGAVRGISASEKLNRMLNNEISAVSHAAEVVRIWKHHAKELSFVNTVTALHRLAKGPDAADVKEDSDMQAFLRSTLEACAAPAANPR